MERKVPSTRDTIPGLVSTLSTLVSLMGHTVTCSGTTVSSPRTSSTVVSCRSTLPHTLSPLSHCPLTPCKRSNLQNDSTSDTFIGPMRILSQSCDYGSRVDICPGVELKPSNNGDPFRSPSRPSVLDKTLIRSEFPSREVPSPKHSRDIPPRRRGSDTEFSNHSSTATPGDPSELPRMRHSSGSLDGSSDPCGRFRSRINGLCQSPSHSKLDSAQSPMSRFISRELPSTSDNSFGLSSSPRQAPVPSVPPVSTTRRERTPTDRLSDEESVWLPVLNSPLTTSFLDPPLTSKFVDKSLERLEQEADQEAKKFEKLQSVLYGELAAESKKLRALVRISEAKLAVHREKQTAMQGIMDDIENRRPLRTMSFSDEAT